MLSGRRVVWVALFVAATGAPLRGDDDFGVRLPSAGTVNATAFPPAFGCAGQHTASVQFIPMPSPQNNFAAIPWATPPAQVTFPADTDVPDVPVSLALGTLSPGNYRGFLALTCTSCSTNTCAGDTTGTWTSVTIPHATTFGASPADAGFAGLVSGQPPSIHTLLPNVLTDIKSSTFANLPGATAIFNELDNEYFDVDVFGPELSDVTFVKTVDNIMGNGRVNSQVVPVDGENTQPGDAAYVLSRGSGLAADALASEEIYLGVDMSTQGIHMARQNPGDYYVFTLGDQMGVINKSDLVHSIVHEGLHAVHGGAFNVKQLRGSSRASSIEEEVEAFRVGDAAQSALGLTPSGTVPNARGYNRGSSPAYVPLFPTLVPAAGGTAPAGGGTTAPPGSGGNAPAPSGDNSTGFLLPEFNGFPAEGYCSSDGSGFDCTGSPNFALACDAGMDSGSCTLSGTELSDPCTYDAGGWNCTSMPSAVVSCTDGSCVPDYSVSLGDVCTASGSGYDCSQLPAFELSCDADRSCSLGDESAIALSSPTASSAPLDFWYGSPATGGDLPLDVISLNTAAALGGSRDMRVQLEIVFVSRTRVGQLGRSGSSRNARRRGWFPNVAELFTPFTTRFAPRARVHAMASGMVGRARIEATASATRAQAPAPVRALFTSLGVSTGEAFEVEFLNDGAQPIDIGATGVVLEPLSDEAQKAVREEFARAANGRPTSKAKANGYCLEFMREPPPAGKVFRVAPQELQAQFTPMRDIWRSVKQLLDAGGLSPDSDPTQYFHSIVQWSMWSKENGFDLRSFGEAFLDRTKKNFAAANQPWTDQVRQAVQQIIPNRRTDIERVLSESERLPAVILN